MGKKKGKRKRAGCLATLVLSMSQCLCFSPSPFVSLPLCLPRPLSSLAVSPCLSPSLYPPVHRSLSHLSFRLLSLSLLSHADSLILSPSFLSKGTQDKDSSYSFSILPRFSLFLEIKGTQHLKICSHAVSLHDSLSSTHATFNAALTIPLPTNTSTFLTLFQ